jgi:hypothetical protein
MGVDDNSGGGGGPRVGPPLPLKRPLLLPHVATVATAAVPPHGGGAGVSTANGGTGVGAGGVDKVARDLADARTHNGELERRLAVLEEAVAQAKGSEASQVARAEALENALDAAMSTHAARRSMVKKISKAGAKVRLGFQSVVIPRMVKDETLVSGPYALHPKPYIIHPKS